MRDVSLIMARETDAEARESYLDDLENRWGVVVKPVEYRQRSALLEMLPCGPRSVGLKKPFVQDCSIDIVAESGFGSMSRVGDDPPGLFLGLAPPDLSLAWLDPFGASKTHMPATMLVVGDSGSGKTFALQSIATQGAGGGHQHGDDQPQARRFAGGILLRSRWCNDQDRNRWRHPRTAGPFQVRADTRDGRGDRLRTHEHGARRCHQSPGPHPYGGRVPSRRGPGRPVRRRLLGASRCPARGEEDGASPGRGQQPLRSRHRSRAVAWPGRRWEGTHPHRV